MHNLGIIHRDLKSSNILFTEDMGVQICDFGIARPAPNTTVVTKAAGTYRWMAPEAKGKKVNSKCDLFSFSIVVWELVEHKLPFPEESDIDALIHYVSGERPNLTHDLPEYLQTLIKSCWSQNPYDRPTFAEIIISLDHKMYFRH